MTIFNLEKMLDKVENKFKIVVIAAKRARALNERGFDFGVKSIYKKYTSIAMDETLSGKVKYYDEPKAK